MITTLYLLRHGETAWNALGLWQGTRDVPLNPRGRAQADTLGRALAGVAFDAAYTSPLTRAVETAGRVLAGRGIAALPTPALRELSYGLRQGWGPAARARSAPGLERAWRERPFNVRFPGGESLDDAGRRMVHAIRRIVARHRGECVLVSAHGHVNRLLEMHLHGIPRTAFWDDAQPNGTARIFRLSRIPDPWPEMASPSGTARRVAADP